MPLWSRARRPAIAASGPWSTVTSTTVPLTTGVCDPSDSKDLAGALRILDGGEPDLEHGRAELRLELLRRPLGDHLPVVEHREGVGETIGLFEVLGGEQNGGATTDQCLDHVPEVVAALGVETGGGFVEEEHRRAGDQRRREVEPPAHAARIRLQGAVTRVGELELLEELVASADRPRTASGG